MNDRGNPDERVYQKLLIIVFGLALIAFLIYYLAGQWSSTFEDQLEVTSLFVNAIFTIVLITVYIIVAISQAEQVEISRDQANLQEQQADIMELQYTPRLSIYHEKDTDSHKEYIIFENIGEVPIEGVVRLSLSSFSNTNTDSPILNENIPYEALPDEVKIYDGSAGDWRKHGLFLDPSERTKIMFDLISSELQSREEEYPEKEFFWFRCDAEFHSTIGNKTRQIQRLFMISIPEEGIVFTSEPFWWARKKESTG
ncbi:MAG: hypothetical protein U5J64_10100 [Halobacteriales archaeon]|nr:hypothetical protein [Halobacteriales archaeon]